MIIPFILFIVFLVGLIALLARGFLRLRAFPKAELPARYAETRPFWEDFYSLFVVPTIRVHQEKVRPRTYKEIEKLVRRFRIIVLRVECLLMRFAEYIRGKRVTPKNGEGHKSHYWEQLNSCKNIANNINDSENKTQS